MQYMKKRILASIMILIMMLSLIPTTAIAASELAITVDTSAITEGLEPGATFTVPVNISGNTGFTNGDLKVNYDAQKLELKGFSTSNTIYSKASLKSTNKETGLVSFANFTDPDDEENFISCADNGVLIRLKFTVKNDAVAGETAISISKNPNAAAALKNNNDILNPTFVPGTITVKADTSERTVQFMNGDFVVKSEPVANGGTLTSIPDAPAAADDQRFLGWYAVEGKDYLLDNVEKTITGTEASTGTVITADTTYHAIWASSAMIAAGYAADASGKTTIGVVAAISGLQNFVNGYTGGTVKLLKNVDLAKGYVVIQSGTTVTLDLNGKTLSANGVYDKTTNWEAYGPIVNNGNLALISSTALTDKGVVQLNETAAVSFDSYGALTNHGTVCMENVKLVSESTFADDEMHAFACAYYGNEDATITTIQNCELHANRTAALHQYKGSIGKLSDSVFESSASMTGKPAAVFLDGWGKQQHYGTIENCTITLHCDNPDSYRDIAALYVKCGTLESVTGCTITGPDGILLEDYGGNDCISPEIRTLNSTIEGTNGYAIRTTPDLSSYGDLYKDRKPVINFTGGKYKGTKGAEKYEGSAAITYPAGQQLLQGADGWYTFQTPYTVTFKNGDTVLQTVTCGENGTAAYTGPAPTKDADETYTYTFNGKWADESGNIYTGNQVTNVTSDLTVTAQFDTASAKVVTLTVDGTPKNYTGLKAAADALNTSSDYSSAEIKLYEDDTETEPVTVTKSVTIDLNGHVLTADTAENGITVSDGATLTVKDSSEAGTGVYRHTADNVQKSAIRASGNGTVVNIESGTIKATKGNALTVDDGAAFCVSGGTISGGQNGICVKTQNQSPDCTITGGKILCSGKGYALYMDESVASSIKLSGGSFKNTNTSTYLIRTFGTKNEIKCTFMDGKSLSPSPNADGFYEVREVGTYTFVLKADQEHYNAGETVTVTVSAYGPNSINSFGFTPSYDSDKLELKSVTPANDGNFTVNPKTGTSGYTVNDENGITLGNTSNAATPLVIITFKAKENINDTATITLEKLEMTPSGSATSDKAVVEKELTVNLHDIRVTLTAGNGTINDEKSVTLYAKYGETDLYSDAARKTTATVRVSANEGYRLNDKQDESLWLCGDTGYASFDAIKGMTFTESKTFALQTTKVWTVSFNTTGMTGGSLSDTNAIIVDEGTKLNAAGLPTATEEPGYAFTGWKVGTNSSTVDTNTYVVNGNITLTPVFTAQSYDFTTAANQSTVRVTAGVEADKATYGQSVTFTVTPNNGYVVESVGYRIGDQATALTTLSPDQNGVYTIEGSKITGKVTVEVVTKAFYAVTFTVDTQKTYTLDDENNTFYAKEGTAGLYTDQTFTTRATAPAATATNGYRLADESKNESLWYAGGTSYTTASLFGENATATFSSEVTIYAKTVKQCKVVFDAGDHGTLNGNRELTVDAGTKLEAVTKPTVTPNAGYAFDKWNVEDNTAINKDMTVTAMYKDGTYSISLPNSEIVSVSDKSGISDANVVTHGTGVSFKLTVNHGYLVSSVSYKIGDNAAVSVNKGSDGTYTISIDGEAITGDIAVTVVSQQTVDVTFAADSNGSVDFTTKTVVKGSALGADNVPTVTPNPGYQFEGWYKDSTKITNLENEKITSAVTYTAKFTHATYELVLSAGLTLTGKNDQPITTATHGTNLIFTPTVEGKVVIGITAKIGENAVTVTKNADGSYTIAGDAITGDLTITAQAVDGSWSFIDKEAYKALSANTKIAKLTVSKLSSGNYWLGNDGMYWSSKYNAYVKIVDSTETAESLTAKLSVSAKAQALTLSYTGDINGDGNATPADGGMINDELHGVIRSYTLTEKQRLEMDVNGEAVVTTADIMTILKSYVGIN